MIAVDGRSGAGKTLLAAELRDRLGAPVVTLEDLYGGWDGLQRGIDLLVSDVLEPLRAGRAARVPRYDWRAGQWAPPWVLEPPAVLIVEGVGAGARRAAAYESALIWLEAAAPVRRRRALERDGATFAPYWDSWAAQEDALLEREHTPARAGLVLGAVPGPAAEAGPAAAAARVLAWLGPNLDGGRRGSRHEPAR
ncbi:MAG TPA: hypothetical protein VGD91_14250, partial [Trebonia sp.]